MQKVAPNDLTLISYGMCNLNCVYCTIDKNKYLKQVDDELKKSFEEYETQYVPRILKWFPDRYSLSSLQIWGGEPLWDVNRIFPLLDWIINNYPNFYRFFSSTNFSYNHWSQKIIDIILFFGKYADRKFNIEIQLSMDGPEYINDANRGKGTTKRCVTYLHDLVEKLNNIKIPENVFVSFHGKPTLSVKNIEEDLTSKEQIIQYYQELEKNCYCILDKIKDNEHTGFFPAIPNVASPSPDTSYTGRCFANICRWCRELEQEAEKHFKYFKELCPFSRFDMQINSISNDLSGYRFGCGTGVYTVMMMPNNYYITCHGAFGDIAQEYKKIAYNSERYKNKQINLASFMQNTKSSYVKNEEEYENFSNHMGCALNKNSVAYGEFSKKVIQSLASCGQIDEKYKNEVDALEALNKLKPIIFSCTYNNQAINNSLVVSPTDQYRLFLNGAIDYICQ